MLVIGTNNFVGLTVQVQTQQKDREEIEDMHVMIPWCMWVETSDENPEIYVLALMQYH